MLVQRVTDIIESLIDNLFVNSDIEETIEYLIVRIGITPEELVKYFDFSKSDVDYVVNKISC